MLRTNKQRKWQIFREIHLDSQHLLRVILDNSELLAYECYLLSSWYNNTIKHQVDAWYTT